MALGPLVSPALPCLSIFCIYVSISLSLFVYVISLSGIQFYKNNDDAYCEECYLDIHAKRCAACYKPIEGNTKFIDYDGKFWHSKCFSCAGCEAALAGEKFIIREGNRFCMSCK